MSKKHTTPHSLPEDREIPMNQMGQNPSRRTVASMNESTHRAVEGTGALIPPQEPSQRVSASSEYFFGPKSNLHAPAKILTGNSPAVRTLTAPIWWPLREAARFVSPRRNAKALGNLLTGKNTLAKAATSPAWFPVRTAWRLGKGAVKGFLPSEYPYADLRPAEKASANIGRFIRYMFTSTPR